jgi:hypothetical protein
MSSALDLGLPRYDWFLLDTEGSAKREGNGSRDPCTVEFVSVVALPKSALDIRRIEI